jgi:hypothetical protein
MLRLIVSMMDLRHNVQLLVPLPFVSQVLLMELFPAWDSPLDFFDMI